MIIRPGREEGPDQVEGSRRESAATDAEEKSDDHAKDVLTALTERAQDIGGLGSWWYDVQLTDLGEDGDESGGGGRVVRVFKRERIGGDEECLAGSSGG